MMPDDSTEQLAMLITQRRQCLIQIRDMGRKQSELIVTGEMEPLLRLLSAKQQLLAAIQTIERNLEPHHEVDPEQRIWSSPEARANCAQQASDCRRLLEEVMQLEKQNEQKITLRRDEVASRLQAVHTAHLARGAYQSQQNLTSPPLSPNLLTADFHREQEPMLTSNRLDIQQ